MLVTARLRLAILWLMLGAMTSAGIALGQTPDAPWRSALYPEAWAPGQVDGEGRFLHDFSYAGYHAGESPLPVEPPGVRIDVTAPPYLADSSGQADATEAIQAAIDAVGVAGGGMVYLPPGTYRIAPRPETDAALRISRSGVVLRGAGVDATRLYLATSTMRGKATVRVGADEDSWTRNLPNTTQMLREDLRFPTTVLPTEGRPRFQVGDWIIVRHDTTEDWNREHHMACGTVPDPCWNPNAVRGALFYRQVVAVDDERNTITIDAPTRYYLLTRDRARVYRVAPHITEVGVEHLSIGEQEHPGDCATDDQQNNPARACNYDTHDHDTVLFSHVVDGWVRGVRSYAPATNPRGFHLLSDGIELTRTRRVTVQETDIRKTQNRGGGGNGYGYVLDGNDNLIQGTYASECRHNYDFKTAWASGNVIRDSTAARGALNSDFHMHLSVANLVENVTLDHEIFEAAWRGSFGTVPYHAHSGTQNVFWNIRGVVPKAADGIGVISNQFGWGYVIGTQGPGAGVRTTVTAGRTEPEDFVEGIGRGATLVPQSLYADQLARRLANRTTVSIPLPPVVAPAQDEPEEPTSEPEPN